MIYLFALVLTTFGLIWAYDSGADNWFIYLMLFLSGFNFTMLLMEYL